MRYLLSFALLIFTAAYVAAQESGGPSNAPGGRPTESRGGKVPVPAEKARPITIPKTSAQIVIDGRPDEEAWKTAAVFKDFYQVGPGYNTAPSRPTEVYMLYDEHNLYVAFKCWDERDKIRATVAKRDEVFGEDNVRMWLDTYDDHRRAYVIGFNPLGIQQDGILTEGSNNGADFSVDIVMESKGVIEDWGWSVEAKIPFKSLRYSAGKGKMWGFNVARNIDRFNDELDAWLPDDRDVSGMLVKHGRITGLDEIKYERTLEIVPSVTVSETGKRKRTISGSNFGPRGSYDPIFNPIGIRDPGKFINDPLKADLGVNLKYTISPNVTLDAAINPDYAEIEADAPVVSANQRFPIYFSEKRPFFLEGKDIFETPLQTFYSRTIIDPDIAAKLTGKIGKTTFGFIGASDNAPGNFSQDERGDLLDCQRGRLTDPPGARRTCPNEEFIDKNALFGIVRVKRDFGADNNIGYFGSVRVFPQERNFTSGFDGKIKLNPKTIVTFQAIGTYSRTNFYDPNTDTVTYRGSSGLGYYFNIDNTADTRGWFIEMSGRSRDYRADAGFTRRTNSNTLFLFNRFSTKSNQKAKIIRAGWNQFGRWIFDFDGRPQGGLVGNNLNLNLQGNMFMNIEAGVQFEKIYEEEFGPKRNVRTGQAGAFFGAPTRSAYQPYISVYFNKTFNKKVSMEGSGDIQGNTFDYDFGAGPRFNRASPAFTSYLGGSAYQNYILGLYQYQGNPNVNPYPVFAPPPPLDPGRGLQWDVNLSVGYKPIDPLRFQLDYTKSRLTRNDTGKVAFDTNIFTLRSTYQFTRFVFVRARWDYDTLRARAAGQFLFGWNPNPGTAFYVGYNDDFNYNGYSPLTNQFEPRFRRNSRTFFIRMSYLFRKSY